MADIAQALLEANLANEEQIQEAKRSNGPVTMALVDKKVVDEQQLVTFMKDTYQLEVASLASVKGDDELAKLVPEKTARQQGMLPLRKEGSLLIVATCDPSNDRAVDRLARQAGLSVQLQVAGPNELKQAIDSFYSMKGGKPKKDATDVTPPLKEIDQKLKFAIQELDTAGEEGKDEDFSDATRLEINDLDPPIMRVVNTLLLKALKMRASDLHIETLEEELRVRFRIDGALHEVMRVSGEMKSALASRIKIMSEMDIAEKRVPQDGAIKVNLGDGV